MFWGKGKRMKIKTDHRKWNQAFVTKENEGGYLTFLGHKDDQAGMNWIEGSRLWGEVICPDGIQAEVSREFTEAGNLKETYRFQNVSEFPVFLQKTDTGICTTFNDSYEEAEKCLAYKCHTHLFCGNHAAYVMALRMSGEGANLGLKLLQGNIGSYSIERDLNQRSDDRGDFILHPVIGCIEPGEEAVVQWELFWFDTRERFYSELLEVPHFPVVFLERSTYFTGETMCFKAAVKGEADPGAIKIMQGAREIPFAIKKEKEVLWISAEYPAEQEGEYRFRINMYGKETFALLYCAAGLEDMVDRRCKFLAEKQQFHGSSTSLDGAYLIYDREEDCRYYDHTADDHNGGRERLAMGALMALWRQRRRDGDLENSLKDYVTYVYRELYRRGEGIVYNDISYNLDWHRMYNYPWMAVFQLELFRLWKKQEYLEDAYQVMKRYYEQRGTEFYAIGIPVYELREELLKAGLSGEAEVMAHYAKVHADHICNNGVYYPASEVSYEQSIVAPAVSCLLQGYQITGKEEYLREAERQLRILSLFNGRQPDYHLFENAIRHWDGYWFGKNRMYGDTFPHYWSALTGVEYARYGAVTGNHCMDAQASASLRGCLNLFFADGCASCAMVFPERVNGRKGNYYDPWANDQDWALYYALKYREITEGGL